MNDLTYTKNLAERLGFSPETPGMTEAGRFMRHIELTYAHLNGELHQGLRTTTEFKDAYKEEVRIVYHQVREQLTTAEPDQKRVLGAIELEIEHILNAKVPLFPR